MATEAIQAIVVTYKENEFNYEEVPKVILSKMSNLRLMIIKKTDYYCSQPKELVRLDLYESKIEYLWEGVMRSVNLKFINLCRSKNLIRTPDFSAWVKLSIWSQPLSQWLPYDERHSQKEFTILVHFLQGLLCRTTVYGNSSKSEEDGFGTEFQIIIPSCLTQKVGNSISIELPSNWYNSKWIGLALWALLPNPGSIYGLRAREVVVGKMPQNHCAFELFTTRINVEVKTEYQLNNYLLYLSRDEWFATVGNGECSQIKVIFNGSELFDPKIGVSLVYEKDADEFNQTNEQCLIESFGEVRIFKLTGLHIYVVGDDNGDDDDDEDDDEDDDGDDDEDDDQDDDGDDEDDDEDDDGDDDEDDDQSYYGIPFVITM
ncbi:hypothetical protein CMV_025780 [Castanea mollissima]|uniref:C-JID domain-containing protein n=1 Tax=Castanea mollissima TaxID=60419 RepID=A0A8J4V4N4_9ROSI|nr:hypothetical protein CMV_025780 [Castanea mollissima]